MRRIVIVFLVGLVAGCGSREPPGRQGPSRNHSSRDAGLPDSSLPTVVFLGTSLTAGLGLDPSEAYPALIQQKIDSAGLPFRVVNAGVSGEVSAGGLRRLDWLLRQPMAALVIELGANDALQGQDLDSTRHNLQAIIDRTRASHPQADIIIAGMQAPPNLGGRYTRAFRAMFPDLAQSNRTELIPFLLDSVAGIRRLNQSDGIHPNVAGERIVARNVWRALEPVLRKRAEG